ncbi:hypothetical protein EPUS_04714 [Endocarpon pusillum Z07020]|uniref:Uncharacterized protein n=1 Tax=Endocarpon pusillum (strain Z07020 / HMAS-L-300199) TaxID=1263415 RepID=U1GFB7_ENDPU|nr:uncharacterized protein EPUS_04714 [Endocarpon pusillum Z07020]ERF70436.1 hypothetical protein EPUS_04714 [Endocarpon pusillum Z07020]
MPSPRGLQSATGADGEILVAIDLGTTFSGVAWTHTARPGTHTVIDQWPDEHDSLDGITSAKVPTEICYDEDGIRWGFQIPASRSRY